MWKVRIRVYSLIKESYIWILYCKTLLFKYIIKGFLKKKCIVYEYNEEEGVLRNRLYASLLPPHHHHQKTLSPPPATA